MPFYYNIPNVSIFPHILSRIDPVNKNNYRTKYKKIKKYGSAAVLSGVGVTEGTELVKDIISSKLKAYGYKSLFAVAAGPFIQFVSLPFYVFSYGSKIRRFALSVTEVGAKMTKGQMGIVNWAWIGVDIVFFGEIVPITDDCDFFIVNNETADNLTKVCREFID